MPNDALTFDPTPYAGHLACVRTALDSAEDTRGTHPPTAAASRKAIAELLDFDESYLPGPALYEIPELDVAAMVDRLVTECSEIDIPDHKIDHVEIVWKRAAGKSMGAVVLGTLKPVGKRERENWRGAGPAPWWRLTLALDVFLMLTPDERWRLVAHELMHATVEGNKPKSRAHDVEEFAATIARYGLIGWSAQPAAIAQAMARPEIVEELREWSVDPTNGQGLLFKPSLMTPVGW